MAAPTDTRILTQDELEQYAKDYHLLEDLSHYDFSSLDFDSDYFRSLPPAEQYSILNAARLRSRLRMGYSKEQLDEMFPDRLAFSRFQIQRLKERNDYTQRLMNLNGMNDVGPQRIAGEKGREYFLVRNEGVEGGWVLGTTKNEVGGKEKPVLVDVEAESEEDEDVDVDFEDVPLETSQQESPLLAKIPQLSRKAQPTGYGKQTKLPFPVTKKPQEGLFILDDEGSDIEETGNEVYVQSDDDTDLQTAINLSMQPTETPFIDLSRSDTEDQQMDDSIISEDAELNQAIALSLSHHQPRPTTSSSNNSDLQRALELSRNEMSLQRSFNAQSFDESDIDAAEDLYSRYPPSAKDKGKGRAISLTPERPVSAGDEELQRTIELSRSEFRGDNHIGGVGPSGVANIVEESPSKGGVLGRSMFRKKQNVLPKMAEDGITKQVPPNNEVLEIVEKSGRDAVLEEKIEEASPVAVPTSTPIKVAPPRIPSAAPEFPEDVIQSASHSPSIEFTVPEPEIPAKENTPAPIPGYQSSPASSVPQGIQPTERPQSSQDHEEHYFSDDEDEDLIAQLAAEAEEHARFTSSINPHASTRPEDYSYSALDKSLTEEDFEREMRTLRNQQKKDRRDADEVNQLMVTECQQLLRLFGLPFITAPMEAEAQCAELVHLGLVDGIVTDDSDIFLFGGTRVYKNMFNQGKFVECYLQSDLERDFNLDRQKFINLAHLLGSDYAEGLSQVGPVNALELLSDFHGDHGLEEFRNWWIAVQQGRLPKDSGESEFRRKFRKNSTKIFLPNDFPNRVIDQAYLKPEVDHDPQAFVWGVPDLDALRSFLMAQIGWSKERTDEILVPVIKDMNRRQVFHRCFTVLMLD
jgi:DNA excision repair protein ERCC-5